MNTSLSGLRLEQAVAAYTEALKEFTADGAPRYFELVRNNLGAALQILRDRDRAF